MPGASRAVTSLGGRYHEGMSMHSMDLLCELAEIGALLITAPSMEAEKVLPIAQASARRVMLGTDEKAINPWCIIPTGLLRESSRVVRSTEIRYAWLRMNDMSGLTEYQESELTRPGRGRRRECMRRIVRTGRRRGRSTSRAVSGRTRARPQRSSCMFSVD